MHSLRFREMLEHAGQFRGIASCRRRKAVRQPKNLDFTGYGRLRGREFVPGLCPRGIHLTRSASKNEVGGQFMQNGSIMRTERRRGPDVWEYRWREPCADGKRKHRRMVVGSINQFVDKLAV